MDKDINNSLFKKIVSHDVEFLSKTRGVAHVVREFEGVRDFFTSASMVAFIDLPFMFLFTAPGHPCGAKIELELFSIPNKSECLESCLKP